MKKLIRWHKDKMNDFAFATGLSAYQITWIAFIKGALIGCIIGVYL
tara:strand:- start:1074 stop:1211 length:138 start_codon:yes stop_codon:yes gene_type:complete